MRVSGLIFKWSDIQMPSEYQSNIQMASKKVSILTVYHLNTTPVFRYNYKPGPFSPVLRCIEPLIPFEYWTSKSLVSIYFDYSVIWSPTAYCDPRYEWDWKSKLLTRYQSVPRVQMLGLRKTNYSQLFYAYFGKINPLLLPIKHGYTLAHTLLYCTSLYTFMLF